MQILRPKETAAKIGMSARHLRRLEQQGKFPKRRQLFDGGKACGHLESEVDEWIASHFAAGEAAQQ